MHSDTDPIALAGLYADLAEGRARQIRERARLAQADLAQAIGASRSAVASWEDGRRRPRGELAHRYRVLLESLEETMARRGEASSS